MKNITMIAVLLLTCQLCMTAMADSKMREMTAHNYFSTIRSGAPVNPPQISYVTNGKPLQGWVFNLATGSTDIMSVSIDNGGSYIAQTAGGTGTYDGDGTPILFNGNPGANKPVVIKMRSTLSAFGLDNTFYNNATFTDGWIRVKTLSFPGSVIDGKTIGDGVWLGWGDNVFNLPKNDPAYQWDDLVFILQGVTPVASDGSGHTVPVILPTANTSGNRLFVTSWREENKQ